MRAANDNVYDAEMAKRKRRMYAILNTWSASEEKQRVRNDAVIHELITTGRVL